MIRGEDGYPGGSRFVAGKVLERQGCQLLAYLVLGAILLLAALQANALPGRAWGRSTFELAAASWILAGIFQFGGALVWRLELSLGLIRKCFGRAGFILFASVFPVVGVARMLLIIPISKSDPNSLPIHPGAFWILVLGPMPLILWAAHSIFLYFPFRRAIGADHFDHEAGRSLETRGIFRYTRNPMYAVILLLLYHPGLWFESQLGLIAAALHHAFVWVHYFCTEKPDLREIYGDQV